LSFLKYSIIVGLLLATSSIYAEQDNIEEIVVTSSKSPKSLLDVPIQTKVITAEQIEKTHATKLEDALLYAPAVQTKEIHGKTGSGIWLQGFDANRVLLLIDGSPVIPSTGATIDISQISIGAIDRIEIIKGAASSLYGTSAMGGVVNVITRKPQLPLQIKTNVQFGNWGQQSANANPIAKHNQQLYIGSLNNNWYGQLQLDLLTSEGFKATENGSTTEGWNGYKNNMSARFGYAFSDALEIDIIPRLYQENVGNIVDRFVPAFGNIPDNYTDKTDRVELSTVLKHTGTHSNWKLQIGLEDYENLSKKFSDRLTKGAYRGLEFERTTTLNNAHILTYGINLKNDFLDVENLKSNNKEVDQRDRNTYELFIHDSWYINDQIEIVPGFRVNSNDRDGSHTAPSIHAIFKWHDLLQGSVNLRTGVANGYRTPHLKELYFIFDHSVLGYQVLGNPNLKPEQSNSLQIGLEWIQSAKLAKQAIVQFNYFYNDIDNLIEIAYSHNLGVISISNYQNFARAVTKGFELIWSQPIANLVTTDLSYTYLDTNNAIINKPLPNRARHNVKLNMMLNINPRRQFIVSYRYESESFIDAEASIQSPNFAVFDLKYNATLNRNWHWYAGINNLTGVQREFNGQDQRPIQSRYVYIGGKWQYR